MDKNQNKICCLQETYFPFENTHRLKVKERKEKGILCKWKSKVSQSIYNYIRIKKTSKKDCNETKKMIYNDRNVTPTRRYNIYK